MKMNNLAWEHDIHPGMPFWKNTIDTIERSGTPTFLGEPIV
jgi:hypothetical protein